MSNLDRYTAATLTEAELEQVNGGFSFGFSAKKYTTIDNRNFGVIGGITTNGDGNVVNVIGNGSVNGKFA